MGRDEGTEARRHKGKSSLWVVVGVIAILGAGIWVWEEVVEDRVIPKRWGTVIEGSLYRSGQLHPVLMRRTFVGNEIDLVVSLIDLEAGSDRDRLFSAAEQETCDVLGIERRVYPLRGDGTGDIANYVAAIKAIDSTLANGGTMLVHCAAGSQRTGGVVACYRVLVQGWSPAEALAEMARYDWDPKDDRAVLDHINANMPELATGLVDLGVLSAMPEPLPRF